MNNYKFGDRSLSYLDDPSLHPQIKVFMTDVLSVCKYDISIIDGTRNAETQQEMFDKGASELDGTFKMSDHQIEKYQDNLGRAIDVIPYIPKIKFATVWDVGNPTIAMIWSELYRAILRIDRLWKQKGIDAGIEFGWTYDINGGRDYPHIGFTRL